MELVFFIESNHFVASFRFLLGVLENENTRNIVLSQEGNPSLLNVRKILRVSALFDFVLFETEELVIKAFNSRQLRESLPESEELVTKALNSRQLRESLPESDEKFLVVAYSNGIFTRINKAGDIFYEDSKQYMFPINRSSHLKEIVGALVFDRDGQVVGVVSGNEDNILTVTRVRHLREFIAYNIGRECRHAYLNRSFSYFFFVRSRNLYKRGDKIS